MPDLMGILFQLGLVPDWLMWALIAGNVAAHAVVVRVWLTGCAQ